MSNYRKKNNKWFIGLFVLFSAIAITPILGQELPSVVLPVILLLLLVWVFRQEGSLITNRITIIVFLFFAIDVFYHLIGISERIGNAITRFSCFMTIVLFLFINDNLGVKEKKFIFFVVLIIIAVNVIDNIRLNLLYPMASIMAIRRGESFKGLNIGTTMFNTLSLLFYVVCLFMLLNTKKRWGRVIYVVFCAVSVAYILFFGMRGSVVAIMFVITTLMLIAKYVSKYKVLWLLLPLLIIPIANPDFIFDIVAKIIPEGRLEARLDDIQNVADEGISDGSFSGRVRLYKVSLNTYMENGVNFMFGIGEHKATAFENGNASTGVGGHSEFIDVLARWGTIGAILIFLIYYLAYKILMAQSHSKYLRNQIKVMYFALVLCGVFKTIFSTNIGIVGFVLMPMSVWMIENEKE